MNYIVIDIEWNQCAKGKEYGLAELPFEIIEIGAVKLNEELKRVDTFSSLIKPQHYKQLHNMIDMLVHIDEEQLQREGKPFVEVMESFLNWCGDDYIFVTWADRDLDIIQSNLEFYEMDTLGEGPVNFYDMQKLFSIDKEDGKERRSLQSAIEMLNISKVADFHRALSDAEYTAKIMQTIDFAKVKEYFSINTYNPPSEDGEEIHVVFPTYYKYISKCKPERQMLMTDVKVTHSYCYLCNKEMKVLEDWFVCNNRQYRALYYCEEHGLIKGRIKIRHTHDGNYYAIKVLKQTTKEDASKIFTRKNKTF